MKSFNLILIEADIKNHLNSEDDFLKVCGDCKLIIESLNFILHWELINQKELYDFNDFEYDWNKLHLELNPVALKLYDKIKEVAGKDSFNLEFSNGQEEEK